MSLSKKYPDKYGEIAVDTSIMAKVQLDFHLDWKEVATVIVKGKREPITVFKPIWKRFVPHLALPPRAWLTDASDKMETDFFTKCSRVIEAFHGTQIGRSVFVEGEEGLGKAALVRRMMDQTENRIWWLWGQGDWVHETKPDLEFPVWRQILLGFQERYPFSNPKYRDSFEAYILRRRPDLHKWLCLLEHFNLLNYQVESEIQALEKMWKRTTGMCLVSKRAYIVRSVGTCEKNFNIVAHVLNS